MRFPFLVCSALLLAPAFAADPAPPAAPAVPATRLAVVLVVDQMRGDYLAKFRPYFVEGGFKRLLEGGMNFENCHYPYAVTVTAPGHATIATGVTPRQHGVIANDWIVRDTWEKINNVEDREYPLVGVNPREMGPAIALHPEKTGRSPRVLQQPTVADQLKQRWGADSRVFCASNKDRSAILVGGKKGDAAYWDELGQMVTSRYYREKLPDWVVKFNAERRVHARFGEKWERLLDPKIYNEVQGPDDVPGETVDIGLTRTFPKVINGGSPRLGLNYYTAFDNSPFSAEFLGAFVERAIREEKLGHHQGPDLLGVSFSQVDTAGHSYGPDSHELMDSVLRLDRVLASLFACLDREVGGGQWTLVLTADHGIPPLPELMKRLHPNIPAGRLNAPEMHKAVRRALVGKFGPLPAGTDWFMPDGNGYYLLPKALAARKVDAAAAAQVVKEALLRYPDVAEAFTRAELLAGPPEGDSMLTKVRLSYYEPGGRDVLYVLKPFFFDRSPMGVTHGTPYEYDTHVPQLWYGAGVSRGVHAERVSVVDIAPTLAGVLGIAPPPEAKGRKLF